MDFGEATAKAGETPASTREAVATSIRGLDGAVARRRGLRVWLAKGGKSGESGKGSAGRKFASALSLTGGGLGLLLFLAGVSGALGMLDRDRGGIHVTLFLAVLIGGQWLVLVLAFFAWLLRRRAAEGFSGVQALAGKLARRLAGSGDGAWWDQLVDGGEAPRAALLWRLARLVQGAGIAFNLGILAGLAGLVLLKHVGFFWETTTESAMRSILDKAVAFLSIPWAAWWQDAVPGAAVIEASRWLPGRTEGLAPGPAAWWEFLLAVTFFWGLLPRALLWLLAWRAGVKALARLDFQGRQHRALWREITGPERVESDEKPLDGVLVLDVGGSGLSEDSLRPFLLRRLRVHPAAWLPVAVLDAGAGQEAAEALAKAPAGVVLLAEGWSLSPARMIALHSRVRASAGKDVQVKFLVANASPANEPAPPTGEESREWIRFVDSLRDPAAEVFFYAPDPVVL